MSTTFINITIAIAFIIVSSIIGVTYFYKVYKKLRNCIGYLDRSFCFIPKSTPDTPDSKKNGINNQAEKRPTFIGFIIDNEYLFHSIKDRIAKFAEWSEENSRFRERFNTILSHELRTPIHGIFGLLEIIESGDCTTAESEEYYKMLRNSAEELFTRINDLLMIEGIDKVTPINEIKATNIKTLIGNVVKRFEFKANERLNIIKTEYSGLSPDFNYPCDEHLMFEMISRLVDNAVKFTKDGTITITVVVLPSDLIIKIKDTGIGIPPEMLKNIYQAYMQGDNRFTRLFGGLGLGIPFADSICKTLGGELLVDSASGVGTTVTLRLPIQ